MSMDDAGNSVQLPPGRGRYAAVGYAVRMLKALPGPVRERLLDSAVSGISASLPPFADIVRVVDAARGVPEGKLWQSRLLENRPDLAAVQIRDEVIASPAGGLPIRSYLPSSDAHKNSDAFVWVHGGAFVLGGLDQKESHWPAIELASSGIPVITVDYRLAIRGVHYPAPQDDVLSALSWAIDHAAELGVQPNRIHLGGASAGGCLVAGATLRLRDEGGRLPASLYLGYPVLQGVLPPAEPDVAAQLRGLDLVADSWVRDMFANWAGDASWEVPYVSPGTAELEGLPPTYVLTCGNDLLRRASEPFAERLTQARVPAWHEVLDGSEHAPLDRPGTTHGEHALNQLRMWISGGVAAMSAQ